MATELNSDEVSSALTVCQTAVAEIESRLKANGHLDAHVCFDRYGFTLYPDGLALGRRGKRDKHQVTYAAALDFIDSLPVIPVWTPSLIEASLGVRSSGEEEAA